MSARVTRFGPTPRIASSRSETLAVAAHGGGSVSTSSIWARPVASSFFSAALAVRVWFATVRERMRCSPTLVTVFLGDTLSTRFLLRIGGTEGDDLLGRPPPLLLLRRRFSWAARRSA